MLVLALRHVANLQPSLSLPVHRTSERPAADPSPGLLAHTLSCLASRRRHRRGVTVLGQWRIPFDGQIYCSETELPASCSLPTQPICSFASARAMPPLPASCCPASTTSCGPSPPPTSAANVPTTRSSRR